jgi:hypothetical protein
MLESSLHDRAAPICEGPIGSGKDKGKKHPKRRTVQVRFIAACASGHLQDFPWWEWVFKDPRPTRSGRLRMHTAGSASLAGVRIVCEQDSDEIAVLGKRTLAGAFDESGGSSALSRLGLRCMGHNPALGIPSSIRQAPGCGEELKPLLRGGSNVYFPRTVSSIYIPQVKDASLDADVLELLDDHEVRVNLLDKAMEAPDGLVSEKMVRNTLRRLRPDSDVEPLVLAEAANRHILIDPLKAPKIWAFITQSVKASKQRSVTREIIETVLDTYLPDWEIDLDHLVSVVSSALDATARSSNVTGDVQDEEVDFRREEYAVFSQDMEEGYPRANLLIRSEALADYEPTVNGWFERISLIHKLRETRAFVGFSRVVPVDSLDEAARRSLISGTLKDWLPAVIVRGEGIFMQLKESRISTWQESQKAALAARVSRLESTLVDLRARGRVDLGPISPRFVLRASLDQSACLRMRIRFGIAQRALIRSRAACTHGGYPDIHCCG